MLSSLLYGQMSFLCRAMTRRERRRKRFGMFSFIDCLAWDSIKTRKVLFKIEKCLIFLWKQMQKCLIFLQSMYFASFFYAKTGIRQMLSLMKEE